MAKLYWSHRGTMRFLNLPILILLAPFAEIAGFVVAGKLLGVWATLALALLSLLAGVSILRREGLSILGKMRSQARLDEVRSQEFVGPAVRAFAAILLIIPGFVTDILALLLFVPAFRQWVWRKIGVRFVVSTRRRGFSASAGSGSTESGPNRTAPGTIDLDEEDYRREPDPKSPWLRRPE